MWLKNESNYFVTLVISFIYIQLICIELIVNMPQNSQYLK